jgi:hypothetical protein
MRSTFPLAVVVLAAAAACARGPSYDPSGHARPTVSGGQAATFPDLAAAKAAFSRTDGPFTAVLEDASWIRLEPDPDQAEQRHPEYAAGLTSFEVTVWSDSFVRPTEENYVLTDSTGRSVSAKPTSYRGTSPPGGRAHVANFTLAFRHVLSKDVEWLRLTREGAGGGTVEWRFR